MNNIVQRDRLLDMARGGGIFLVVLSHTNFSKTGWFSFWDVQLFFFLSGVFLTSKNTLENSLYKKTNSLIFPFLFFSIPLFILIVIYQLFTDGDVSKISFFNPDSYLLGTEWFLLALFICEFEYLLLNEVSSIILRYLIVILLFIIGYVACVKEFTTDTSFITMANIALPFLYLGGYYNNSKMFIRRNKWWLTIASLGVLLVMVFMGVSVGIPALMVPRNPLLYLISSVAGFVFMISCCNILETTASKSRVLGFICKILSFWGYYSLFIFILHWILIKTLYYHIILPRWPEDIVSLIFSVTLCFLFGYVGVHLKKIKFIFK